jgi:hypothetical protein
MPTQAIIPATPTGTPKLTPVARFSGLRVLCWNQGELFVSRGYELLKSRLSPHNPSSLIWERVGRFNPGLPRSCSSSVRLSARLFREGFHALAVLPSGHVVGAVPDRIITLAPEEPEFRPSHQILRGTRPLHVTAGPDGEVFWGEYFDNRERYEVHIYGSTDHGEHWDVAYTFPRRAIRHVHNIVLDRWGHCYWVLTGDVGPECRIVRASLDFRSVEPVLAGSQQARSAALIPTPGAIYFSSDTPLETNHLYRLDRAGNLAQVADLTGSSIYGCHVGAAVFFSTMVEPSKINTENNVCLYGSSDGVNWPRLLRWEKDAWPMRLFQYGNAFLPDGENDSDLLALTTIAVRGADLETTFWRVSP